MKRLFSYQVGIIIWFFLLYNIERLIAPINIASFVYVYAAAIAVLVLALPILYNWSTFRLFLLALIPFFALKIALGYEIAGPNLPITITEMSTLYITLILARLLGQDLFEIRNEITQLTIGNSKNGVNGFSDGQVEIYREVRRARRFKRPVALLTVAARGESVELAINRFIEEAKNGIMTSYVNARVANLLEGRLKDSDVITKYNDYFVILLPETSREQVPSVINRLKESALQDLQIPLEIGFSTFPDEAMTFSGLLQQAETKMLRTDPTVETQDRDPQVAPESGTPGATRAR
jgi:hypothetical protein